MDNSESFLAILIRVIRWITRIVSLLVVLTVLVFFLGEEVFGNENPQGFNVPVPALIVGILMIGGLLAAWKWEIWGGIVSLIGFAGVFLVNPGTRNILVMCFLFGLPALLFIVCGLVQKYYLKEEEDSQSD